MTWGHYAPEPEGFAFEPLELLASVLLLAGAAIIGGVYAWKKSMRWAR